MHEFDPVAYQTKREAIRENKENNFIWNKIEWHFSNRVNMMLFKQSPKHYAPQYVGYCALAVSKGVTVEIESDKNWSE
ncbi:YHS domain-containing (seleno)protein [Shewanella sp. YLB-07]|uniref:YHS domain-containing (seleno)protein n=1 Tax=Shewanella sp. YLB-07 TaxID=2601268 RepID=UPI003A102C5C